ncbi:unnamed protein product [Linum tenue]|uniref:S-protein homolog n=1 Tax=Linum tenue TaxID=586396 RepID=A0AAV0L0I8_9ROSI|nr:unnamed protein product [Linum tenue]
MMVINKALLAAVVLATIIIITARPSVQETVSIANLLSNKILIVHCRSGDGDDLGGHAVAAGGTLRWSFEPSVVGRKLFRCKLAVEDRRISFVAYEQYEEAFSGNWIVRDDGVYGNPNRLPTFLMAAWKQPSTA